MVDKPNIQIELPAVDAKLPFEAPKMEKIDVVLTEAAAFGTYTFDGSTPYSS